MSRLPLFVVALVALASLVGHGPGGEGGKALKGTFNITFMREKWTLTFDGDKQYTLKRKADVVVSGIYTLDRDIIRFQDESGPLASEKGVRGKYKWKLLAGKLTFRKIDDDVEGRVALLTKENWVEAKPDKDKKGRDKPKQP